MVPAPQTADVRFAEVTVRLFVEAVPRVGARKLGTTEASICKQKSTEELPLVQNVKKKNTL